MRERPHLQAQGTGASLGDGEAVRDQFFRRFQRLLTTAGQCIRDAVRAEAATHGIEPSQKKTPVLRQANHATEHVADDPTQLAKVDRLQQLADEGSSTEPQVLAFMKAAQDDDRNGAR